MTTAAELPRLTSLSHGAGCACKLPLATLERLMASVGQGLGGAADANLLVGAAEGDDAAVLRLDDERALVLTTDFFTPIVDDARDWGRIAAANAFSDVYAMGGRPLIALNLTAWPADLPVELLAEVLRGGAEVAGQAGCPVVGGHSIDDPEPKYGLAVVGLADPARLLTIARARPGDRLVLTKPLGTGVVATAVKRGHPDPATVAAAVAAMTTLNRDAAEAALAAGVEAATDVTGFGLLGHLHRMLRASGVSGQLHAARVPFLPGAAELAGAGFVSGGTRNNEAYLRDHVQLEQGLPLVVATLLHDAQTSGGLLLAVAPERLGGLVADLRGRGIEPAVIGRVLDGPPGRIGVRRLPSG
ncbi:MAG: selenide, water dikinase SelD [Actinomycetota bacterium]